MTGDGGLLPALVARVLNTGLQAELSDRLSYERHTLEDRGSGTPATGVWRLYAPPSFDAESSLAKTVTTEIGAVPIHVPRDHNSTFHPKLVPHGARRLDGLEAQVISLYAYGVTTGEIQGHQEEIYGAKVSKVTVSRITDVSSPTWRPGSPGPSTPSMRWC